MVVIYSYAFLPECIGWQHRLEIIPVLQQMLFRTRLAALHQAWPLYIKRMLLIHFLNQKMHSGGQQTCFIWPVVFLKFKICCQFKESRICLKNVDLKLLLKNNICRENGTWLQSASWAAPALFSEDTCTLTAVNLHSSYLHEPWPARLTHRHACPCKHLHFF